MSLRADKGEAQQRKPGRSGSSSHNRGFSGGGGGGKGGGGGPAPSPHSSSAAPAAPALSTNRSYKKSGNGQGPQSRVNPLAPSSEPTFAAVSIQNGSHSMAPSHGPTPSGVKPVDPRNSKALPKAPSSQPATGAPYSTTPKAPPKGDASSSFPLQFGTINTGIMNGMQIPARTSSAPPNLDEQKSDQARHESFRAMPTMPMPTAQMQQPPQTRKDMGVNPSRTGGSHPPTQPKRDVHAPLPSAPTVTAMKPSILPLGAMNVATPFQQSQVPIQLGGPSPQMQSQGVPPSSLQIGNAPQVPQQMFIHSHPLQTQAMMHHGPGLGFTPQMGHQLAPQISNLGIGLPPQFPQQKPGSFVGPGPPRTVKITHPDTHEELRLDKRADSYMDVSTSGQRQLPTAAPQTQSIPTFTPSHQMGYYPAMQPNSYNAPQLFFPTSLPLTSTQMTTGSQAPRYTYPVNQSGQPISFINQPILKNAPGSKGPGPPSSLHSISEVVNLEGLPVSAPSAPVQVTMKPPVGLYSEKVGRPSVTISAPISKVESSVIITAPPSSKAEPLVTNIAPKEESLVAIITPPTTKTEPSVTITPPLPKVEPSVITEMLTSKAEAPNLLKPFGGTTVSQLHRDRVSDPDSSFQQPKPVSEPSEKVPVSSVDRHSSSVVPSSLLTQRTESGISSSAPGTPIGDSGSFTVGTDVRKRDPVRKPESLKEHQKKPGKKDVRHSQNHHQIDVLDSSESRKLTPSLADVVSQDASKISENNQAVSVGVVSTSTVTLPSSSVELIACVEIVSSEATKGQAISKLSSSSGVMLEKEPSKEAPLGSSSAHDLASDGSSFKETGSFTSTSSCPEVAGTILKGSDSSLLHNSSLDRSGATENPAFTVSESSFVKEEVVGAENTEKTTTCVSSDDKKQQYFTSSDLVGFNLKVDSTAEESDTCATTSSDFGDAESKPSTCLTSTFASERKPSPLDILTDKSEVISSLAVGLVGPDKSPLETTNIPASISPEMMSNGDPVSVMLSAPKDKISSESTRSKPTSGKKKKRKELLSKADAAGTSDLYNAYKGPDKKQDVASNSENTDSSLTTDAKYVPGDVPDKDAVADEEDGLDKAELDDWEDIAEISTPKLKTSENGPEGHVRKNHDAEDATSKNYTRDFLLTFVEKCTELPMGFEIGSDIADTLMSALPGISRESYPSFGRNADRPTGGSRGDRRMGGMMDDGKWTKSLGSFGPGVDVGHGPGVMNFRPGQGVSHGVVRNPRGQAFNQFGGGILSGPMQSPSSQGMGQHNTADADRWQRATGFQRGLIPSPQTPLQVMHKAERKYEVGKVSDDEEAKQRQLKGILNKLTPQNFEKLVAQVKEVNIDSVPTLTGVISQIFDKALMEPTFCEMYANFCHHLAGAFPDFEEDNEKITFRRLLLNKCQEEFERGEREQAEADKVEEEGEIKQSEGEREEKRLKARRRMLGNIRLIGELYKKRMLSERIMHECIQKLLGQRENPDEEDIEALCKLMATIGEMIDHGKTKVHIDAYFDMMLKLSTNQKLSSRVRFLLRDAIDLRKNKWQQRRKVDGPKKIEEVHRDAAQERQAQTSRSARGPVISSSARRGPAVDYGPRGSAILTSPSSQQSGSIRNLPPQSRGYAQDVRFDDRHQSGSRTLSVPLPQRHTDDDSITLGPQGGLARGMSIRGQMQLSNVPSAEIHPAISDSRRIVSGPNGFSSMPDRTQYNSREETMPRSTQDRLSVDRGVDKSSATALSPGRTYGSSSGRPNTPEAKLFSEEALRDMSISTIREFYSAKDEREVALCVKELNSPSFYHSMVSLWVSDSFERKDMERDLLARLLVNLCKSHDSLLSQSQLIQGFEGVLSSLEDAVNDAPKAGEFLGRIFATAILENVVSLREIGRLIHEGGEEPGRLLEIGLASDVLASILESIRTEKDDSVLKEILTSSKLQLEDFRPLHPIKSKKLDAFV